MQLQKCRGSQVTFLEKSTEFHTYGSYPWIFLIFKCVIFTKNFHLLTGMNWNIKQFSYMVLFSQPLFDSYKIWLHSIWLLIFFGHKLIRRVVFQAI